MTSEKPSADAAGSLVLCGLGTVDRSTLDALAFRLVQWTGLRCTVKPGFAPPEYAYDSNRSQYNAKVILKRLSEESTGFLKCLAITDVDLFIPILKYVYGLAVMDGPCGLISTHRLRPEFYGVGTNPVLCMDRIVKTTLHELGHTAGLTHCRNRLCIMASSTTIEDTDQKRLEFCATCHDLFLWRLEAPGNHPSL